jgi:F420-non-reducing hydrogenase iron-sulfur subunit
MCTGRLDLSFVLRALSNGSDGVFVGGCWLGECHYLTQGNYDALSLLHITRRLLSYVGIDPRRLRLEWLASSEGMRFAEVVNDFIGEVSEIGPLGEGEGMEPDALRIKLEAITQLIPYIKLVERERLRVPEKSEAEYERFFASDEVAGLFEELVAGRLTISQIMLLLREGPLSTSEISSTLDLSPSEVSRHLSTSARQGLVRYDEREKRFALA